MEYNIAYYGGNTYYFIIIITDRYESERKE